MSAVRIGEKPGESRNHPSEETLERYVMDRLQEAEEACVEEHLLLCEECRGKVEETEDYVRAMQTALAELEQRRSRAAREGSETGRKRRWGLPRLAWAGSLAAIAAAIVMVVPRNGKQDGPVELRLTALRGQAGISAPAAPAGRRLVLSLDIEGLQRRPAYEVHLVGAEGEVLFDRTAVAEAGSLKIDLAEGLPAGRYWVRVFPPGHAKVPLREFEFLIE